MGGFEVLALQSICATYFEKHVKPLISELQQSQEQLRAQVKEIAVLKDVKQAGDVIAKLDALQADVAQKANIARVDEIIAQMDFKMHHSEVSTEAPSTPKFEMWLGEAEVKIDERVTPLADRLAIMEKTVRSHAAKIAQHKAMDDELACKANVRDVPTVAQFQRLADSIKGKANSSKVPTIAQFQELSELVDSKASASCVPSDSEVAELRSAVNKKANANSVPSTAEFQKFSADVQGQLKASKDDVEKGLQQKADSAEVARSATVDTLRNVMERKLTFLANRLQKTAEMVDNVMNQQAMVCYVQAPPQCQGGWAPDPRGTGTWMMQPQGDGQGGWADCQQAPCQQAPCQQAPGQQAPCQTPVDAVAAPMAQVLEVLLQPVEMLQPSADLIERPASCGQ